MTWPWNSTISRTGMLSLSWWASHRRSSALVRGSSRWMVWVTSWVPTASPVYSPVQATTALSSPQRQAAAWMVKPEARAVVRGLRAPLSRLKPET